MFNSQVKGVLCGKHCPGGAGVWGVAIRCEGTPKAVLELCWGCAGAELELSWSCAGAVLELNWS